MEEFFKINHIDVGFANHPTEDTFFTKGSLDTEVIVRKGKLRISFLTPAIEITDDMHNGMLNDSFYDNLRKIDYLRMVTYYDLAIEGGQYNTQIQCPYLENGSGFEVYNFPETVKFHGVIDIQEGYVHVKGELKSTYPSNKIGIPIEIKKSFEAKPLIPKRNPLKFKQALYEDPLHVHEIKIESDSFATFPKEILGFKNLESLWVGARASFNFDAFPGEFYELKKLHTIQIYGGTIKKLSKKIIQLQNLEELEINNNQITELPPQIFELPLLSSITLKNNQLTSLPESICNSKSLKHLHLDGNAFKKLPNCLQNIENVSVDRKYQKLYMDMSYKSKNPNAIDESLYDLTHYPEQKKWLEETIMSIPEIAQFKDLIVDCSTMATHLIYRDDITEIPLGMSKVGGEPDLPPDIEHPQNQNGELYVFHAQINCEEIADYQMYLPKNGMLYFFVNDEEYAQKPTVIYSETTKNLSRYEYDTETRFIDDYNEGNIREEVAVRFENYISIPEFYNACNHGSERYPKYRHIWEDDASEILEEYDVVQKLRDAIDAPEGHAIHCSVFTQHESPQEYAAIKNGGEPHEWMTLLNLDSVGDFNFWDAGTLTYCIHKKDLAIKDFSNINTSIESS